MALEIKCLPTNYLLNYDDISELKENDHKKAYVNVVVQFFKSISILFDDSKLLIPSKHYRNFTQDTWISVFDVLEEADEFANFLYNLDAFDFSTIFLISNVRYKLIINSDPVLIHLTKQ